MRKLARILYLAFTVAGMVYPSLIIPQTAQSGKKFSAPSQASAASLKAFLQDYSGDEDKTIRYLDAWIDLNGDGYPEVVVHLIGDGWCGSGGCTTLVLEPKGSSYKIVTKIPITHLPISVLNTRSNNWNNLTVWVQGGGIQEAYEAELRFDGKSYPDNPTVPPARSLIGEAKKEIIIPDDAKAAKFLYP
jgi:hypothetical protein